MDKALIDAARCQYAEDLFETVKRCDNETNRNFLQKLISIAAEYLTKEQKKELRRKGFQI